MDAVGRSSRPSTSPPNPARLGSGLGGTARTIAALWFQQVRARIEQDGPPPVTFATFLGDAIGQMAANQVANLAQRRIRTVLYACSRPL